MTIIRYVIEHTCYTTGSMGGRDDGYPYTKVTTYDNIESFSKALGTVREISNFYAEEVTKVEDKVLNTMLSDFQYQQALLEEKRKKDLKVKRLEQLRAEAEKLEQELKEG